MISSFRSVAILLLFSLLVSGLSTRLVPAQDGQTRPTDDDERLRGWLENMLWYHSYSQAEMQQVTGLSATELSDKLRRFQISAASKPARSNQSLLVLPYPGGRHPRIGFLDGAVNPQRETKLSVFAPWAPTSYAVLDVPEALWSNLGLTYLAHTHIDTIWTRQGIELEQKEWTVLDDGTFQLVRTLPNGIELGARVTPKSDHLQMRMWLTNGSEQPLSDLRVQNCVMLKGMHGFEQQTNANKLFKDGYAVAGSADRTRWIISGWNPVQRAWGNERVPCLHSDPQFADCAVGQTQWLQGWFSFYRGHNIEAELARIESTDWRDESSQQADANLVGQVVDAQSGEPLPCRLYVQAVEDKQFHFARSRAADGSAVTYDRQMGSTPSIERHTTLSAHGFELSVPPGRYRIRAQLGKEYLPAEVTLDVQDEQTEVRLPLKRFANMAERGWYSGDTHVHRSLSEIPNVMQGEDLNVALPLSYWVRDSAEIPSSNDSSDALRLAAEPIYVDPLHVYYPINTEYEIFTIAGRPHTLGAVFVLNHQTPFELTAPPVRKIAAEARRQGAILDLDKHSWNWSVMLVPLMNVDLFELSNNHHWRTRFGFSQWTEDNKPPTWPEIETDEHGFTEQGWTEFGLQTYYAFLNCGFRMRVTAGTASGVHPVPLGHSRVYVHCGDSLDYHTWMEHLNQGHSFVTQGPLMDVRFNGELPGTTWQTAPPNGEMNIQGEILSERPLLRVEAIHNGQVSQVPQLASSQQTESGAYRTDVDVRLDVPSSGWIALRCYEQTSGDAPPGKIIFAHSNPVFVDIPGAPLAPRRRDVQYFVDKMTAEIERNRSLLSESELAEYIEAKAIYEKILERVQMP